MIMSTPHNIEPRVAVLVDCDNTSPDILDHALRVVAQFGRVVLRRGYGNLQTLSKSWQEALVRQAFTPCLQYQYAAGKNTADIAMALDALEAMFDHRAEKFCLVTSDSDFAYLCRKLRERGATVCIVGETKTPEALRNASDLFFEWAPAEKETVVRFPVGDIDEAGARHFLGGLGNPLIAFDPAPAFENAGTLAVISLSFPCPHPSICHAKRLAIRRHHIRRVQVHAALDFVGKWPKACHLLPVEIQFRRVLQAQNYRMLTHPGIGAFHMRRQNVLPAQRALLVA